MSSKVRGAFLIVGSIVAFIGFWIPGLYGVSYKPPANTSASKIVLNSLSHFGGSFTGATSGVYSGFNGPIDLHLTWISILVTFALGLFAEVINLDKMVSWIKENHPLLSVGSQVTTIGSIIWEFRFNQTPYQITQAFITDLGRTQTSINASHYLSSSLGFGFLILLFGFLIGSAGTYSKRGCLLLLAAVVFFFGLLFYTKITTGSW